MKKSRIILAVMLFAALTLTGCEPKTEENIAQPTETYMEENEVQVVYHDTEDVDFRIALIEGDMEPGFERLAEDARKGEAANDYRFYEYEDFSKFKSLFDCGTVDIATLTLEDALAVYRENPDLICVVSINAERENGYGVTVANTDFVKTYPAALQVFLEEMSYSAKEATCIMGDEMRYLIEEQLTSWEQELPGDEFYYPLPEPEDEETTEAEEM